MEIICIFNFSADESVHLVNILQQLDPKEHGSTCPLDMILVVHTTDVDVVARIFALLVSEH
jgi:hypothetical protein